MRRIAAEVIRAGSVVALSLALFSVHSKSAFSQVEPKRWVLIGEAQNFSTWLDTLSLVRQGNTRYAWTQARYRAPQPYGEAFIDRSTKRHEYDCGKKLSTLTQWVNYLGDSVVSSGTASHQEWDAAVPGSMGEAELDYVCGTLPLPKPRARVLGGPSPLASSAWRRIGVFGDSGSTYLMSINATKNPRKGAIVQAWFLEVYPMAVSDSTDDSKYNQKETLEAFDCLRHQSRLRRIVLYLNGSRVKGWEYPEQWDELVPESIGEIKLRFACSGR